MHGSELWRAFYQGVIDMDYGVLSLIIDSDSNIYVTGRSTSPGAPVIQQYATLKYNRDGNLLWEAFYDGPEGVAANDEASAIAMDANGNVYVTGYSGNSEGGKDFATIKYSQDYDPPPDPLPVPVIDKIGNRRCLPGEKIRIRGSGFGEVQGDSIVYINRKTLRSTSRKIKVWTDTLIKVKIPFTNKDCSWFKHGNGQYRKRKVWVTVDGVDSNINIIKVLKPDTCP